MKYFLSLVLGLIILSCAVSKSPFQTALSEAEISKSEELVKISTNYGDIIVKLYDETPKHKANFLKLVNEGYYDSLLFHRVMNKFMIQGGDPESKLAKPKQRLGMGGPEYKITQEFNPTLFHKKGALAAARQPDDVNPEKASSGSQFYIVQGKTYSNEELDKFERQIASKVDSFSFSEIQRETYLNIGGTPFLDMGYTVFGEVVAGLNVVDSIAIVKTDRANRPLEDERFYMEVISLKDARRIR